MLVGHSGHPEVEGTMGQYISEKGKIHLIETNDDIDKLKIENNNIAYVTQTTLSVDDTKSIVSCLKNKFPGKMISVTQHKIDKRLSKKF